MRRCVREALKRRRRIAVVCGAWHARPRAGKSRTKDLIPTKKDDDALLAKLPKMKTTATWIPWTHRRLARAASTAPRSSRPAGSSALEESEEKRLLDRICGGDKSPFRKTSRKRTPSALDDSAARCLRKMGSSPSRPPGDRRGRLADSLATMRGRSAPNIEDSGAAPFLRLRAVPREIVGVVRNKLEVGNRSGPFRRLCRPFRSNAT